MSAADVIIAQTKAAVAYLSQPHQFKRLTSSPANEGTRTYGTATAFSGVLTNRQMMEEYDEKHGSWVRREHMTLRIDETTILKLGDLVVDVYSVEWAVSGIMSGAYGSTRYTLSRDIPLVAAPNRNGGV